MNTNTQTIEQRLRQIFENQLNLNPEQLTPSSTLGDDLGCDSLDMVELLMAVEEEFKDELGGEIPESAAEKFSTFGDVLTYVQAGGKPSQ